MRGEETLVFLHIPKTGGSTLKVIIARQYGARTSFLRVPYEVQSGIQELSQMDANQKRMLRFVGIEHAPYGIHTVLPKPCVYVTILREPWHRMVSDYFHAVRTRGHSFYRRFQEGATLADFVRYRAYEQRLTNPMTRLVSGMGAFPPFEPLPENALDVAKRNIQAHFSVAGILEQFDASLLLMKKRHGWGNVFYRRRNVGRYRSRDVEVDESVKQEFREANALDYELYAFVKQRLEDQIAQAGDAFQRELRWFQFWNGWYQRAYDLARRVKRAVL